MSQYVLTFTELFEQKIDITNNWVDLFDANLIELVKLEIETYGLPLDELYTLGGVSNLEARAIEYGIANVSKQFIIHQSGIKSQEVIYVGPIITINWFEKKLQLVDKILTKKYKNLHIIELRVKKDLIFHGNNRSLIETWKTIMQKRSV